MADVVFKGRHFAPDLILLCVRWYCRYGVRYRDLEQVMAEGGVAVDHSTCEQASNRDPSQNGHNTLFLRLEMTHRWDPDRRRSGSHPCGIFPSAINIVDQMPLGPGSTLVHSRLAAKALVITIDDRAQADGVVIAARAMRPDLLIVVRARDARDAAHLYGLGATDAVPETIEASLQLSEAVLVDLGVPMGLAIASIHGKRAEFQAEIRAMAPGATIRPRERRRLRDVRRVSDA